MALGAAVGSIAGRRHPNVTRRCSAEGDICQGRTGRRCTQLRSPGSFSRRVDLGLECLTRPTVAD
jgi:hypothetical protein